MPNIIPIWIQKLKPGEYKMSELIKITTLTRGAIHPLMKKYGAKIKQIKKESSNFYYYLYIWKGLN